jgi:predicted nucleotidyltransferase component of viral defense system
MLNLNQILEQYPLSLRPHRKSILKEYLQYKILNTLFNSEHATKLVLLGGTALRIVYEGNRFSEDLDFDNFGLSEEQFFSLGETVKKDFQLEGLEVELKNIVKDEQERKATHVYIRIPKLLHELVFSALPEEKIEIHLDSEPQHYVFEPEKPLLRKFEVLTHIQCVSKNLLLSQKIFSAFHRNRTMGRDFYDIVSLYGIGAQPDMRFLEEKICIHSQKELKKYLLENSTALNFSRLAEDVEPFLFQPKEKRKVATFADFVAGL